MQLRLALLLGALGVASAFTAGVSPLRSSAAAPLAAARTAAAPSMLVEPSAIDAATTTIAAAGLSLPIPAFSPAKVRARGGASNA